METNTKTRSQTRTRSRTSGVRPACLGLLTAILCLPGAAFAEDEPGRRAEGAARSEERPSVDGQGMGWWRRLWAEADERGHERRGWRGEAGEHEGWEPGEHHRRRGHEHHGRERWETERGPRSRGAAGASAARSHPAWATYAAECGSCHLAFPPAMLPPASWERLLGSLDQHFDTNAEIDEKTQKTIGPFLSQNASSGGPGATPLRITDTGWWRREHHEISPRVFQRKSVASAANCGACHPGANEGAFDEHQVRIPPDAPVAR